MFTRDFGTPLPMFFFKNKAVLVTKIQSLFENSLDSSLKNYATSLDLKVMVIKGQKDLEIGYNVL